MQGAKILPLHSSLATEGDSVSKKNKKKISSGCHISCEGHQVVCSYFVENGGSKRETNLFKVTLLVSGRIWIQIRSVHTNVRSCYGFEYLSPPKFMLKFNPHIGSIKMWGFWEVIKF